MSKPVPTPDGTGVREFLAVMNQLRSPGGCPWDAEQTHQSLTPHLVEEAYELVDAIENGTRADLLEELGDLLLQVVFHARIAQEHPEEPFDIDDIARGVSYKLRRRHPYIFPEAADPQTRQIIKDGVTSIAEQEVTWESAKAAEKQRESVFDGIPRSLTPLLRAQKILHRARRAELESDFDAAVTAGRGEEGETAVSSSQIGHDLLRLVRQAQAAEVDAEAALRAAVRDLENQLRAAEKQKDGPQT